MADFIFNLSKGKVAEFTQRVIDADPADCCLHLELITGTPNAAALRDYDNLASVLADSNVTVCDFTNYAPKQVINPTINVDDAIDEVECALPLVTWSNAGNGMNNFISHLIVGYDPDMTSGDNSQIIPLTFHSFENQTDGSDVTAEGGFYYVP